jgi:hypothetical protein
MLFLLCGGQIARGQVSSYQFSTAQPAALAQSGAGSMTLAQGAAITNQNYPASLGFDFPFNGERFSSINVSADGWVWFGAASAVPNQIYAGSLRPLNSSGGSGVISVFGIDLRGTANTLVFTRTGGTAPNRTFTVQWQNITVAVPSGATPATFIAELVLSENGLIRINFGAATVSASAGVDAQIGLRGKTAADFQLRAPFPIGASQAACWFVSYSRTSFPQNISILFTPPAPPAVPTTFSFSGRVVRNDNVGIGIPNPVLLLNNSRTVVGDAQGYFTISGLANGQYRLRPQIAGVTFNPPEDIFTIQNSNINDARIRAPLATLILSTTLNNARLPGVNYTVQSATFRGTATILAATNQANINLANDTYTITPVLAGYTFSPSSAQVTIANGANATLPAFQASVVAPPQSPAQTLTINGIALAIYQTPTNISVTDRLANVPITLVRAVPNAQGIPQAPFTTIQTQTSSQDGTFSFTVPQLPVGTRYYYQASTARGFSAFNETFATSGSVRITASVTASFLARVEGRVTQSNGQGLANVAITLSNGKTTTTNVGGYYAIGELQPGNYTVTASLNNLAYTFVPASPMVSIAAGRSVVQNFTASVPMQMQSGFVAPVLLAPGNGVESIANANNTLSGLVWQRVPEATDYLYQFSDTQAFSTNLLTFSTTRTSIDGVTLAGLSPTASGRRVFWRVKARNASGETPWSEVRFFVFKTPAPSAPVTPTQAGIVSGFDPRIHGFSITNTAYDFPPTVQRVWVPEYFSVVNYAAEPFASLRRTSPEFDRKSRITFPSRNTAVFSGVELGVYLWEDFERGYGRFNPVYVNNNGNKTITTTALEKWNPVRWIGSCGGFARAAVLGYAGVYNRNQANKVSNDNFARRLIHSHQSYQILGRTASKTDDPNTTVQKIIAAFQTNDVRKHPILSIIDVRLGGHALVPYRVNSGRNATGQTIDSVFVYDPNETETDSVMRKVVLVNRATNSWRYFWNLSDSRLTSTQGFWVGTNGLYVAASAEDEVAIDFPGRPLAALTADDDPVLIPQRSNVSFNEPSVGNAQPLVSVSNSFGTIQNGKDPLGADNQFPGASVEQNLTGAKNAALADISGFSFPRELTDTLSIAYRPVQANAPNTLAFTNSDRFSARVDWTAADTRGQGLNVNVPNDAVQFTSNSTVPEANLTIAKLDETKAEWENVVRIKLRGVVAGDSLLTHLINDGKSVLVASSGGAGSPSKTYDISFSRGVGQTFERLQLKPNEAHTFVIENWDNIEKSGIVQLLDTNKDNTFDEIRTLRTATSIRTASNDGSFAVSVFPNPASAMLTMQFTLAEATEVHAELLNLLGQPVKTLFSGFRSSGVHSFAAETDGLPNGTYFLRIRAGNATVVKPVQLIK